MTALEPAEPSVPVDPPPAQLDLREITTHTHQKRPIIPVWMRNRGEFLTALRWLQRYAVHAAGFHSARLPLYAARLVARSPRGLWVCTRTWWCWVWHVEQRQVRLDAVRRNATSEYLHLSRLQKERVRHRWIITGILFVPLSVGVVVFLAVASTLWVYGTYVVVVLLLGVVGTTADRRVIERATVSPLAPPRLSADSVTRALRSLGISGINAKDAELTFPAPITRDGPGWRADVDLPHGVTPGAIMEKRAELASGLRRPLGCVWPEPARDEHAGRLILWVGDQDLAKAKQPPWPLAKTGRADLFNPVPFGTDQRGRVVTVTLMFASMVVGAVPRVGKALALDTPVPTPTGWTTMGELNDGDEVFDETGRPCRVVKAHPIRHDRPCFEVEFSDGSVIVADAEHLWQVETRSGRVHGTGEKVLTTADMLDHVRVEADGRLNYSVRVAEPLQLPDAELPISPYTLGAWLGDGGPVDGRRHSPCLAHRGAPVEVA
jgi:hypothetical protein